MRAVSWKGKFTYSVVFGIVENFNGDLRLVVDVQPVETWSVL